MRAFAMGVLAMLGCAGASSNVVVTEFQPEDRALFDHAVDLVEDPVIVEGGFRSDLERRVSRADLIAVIKVTSLSSDRDLRHASYLLTVKVGERLKGKSDKELVLRVNDDEPGFRTVQANEDRLLHDSFVAFVKWERDPESGRLIPHWHLSPDTRGVREKLTFLLRPPPGNGRTEVEVVEP